MLTEATKKWFYVENRYHDYCVPCEDLVATDSALVNVGDVVKFNYFSKFYDGTIKSIADDENTILEEISEASEQRKKQKDKKGSSFHEDRPRQAAIRQQARMAQMLAPKQGSKETHTKKKQLAKDSRDVKKLKGKADLEMQKLLYQDTVESEKVNEISNSSKSKLESAAFEHASKSDSLSNADSDDSSSAGDSDSSTSTVHSVSKQALKVKDSKDMKSLKTLSKSKGEDHFNDSAHSRSKSCKNKAKSNDVVGKRDLTKAKKSKEENALKARAETIEQPFKSLQQSDVSSEAESALSNHRLSLNLGELSSSDSALEILKIKKMEEEMRKKEAEFKKQMEEMAKKEEEIKRKEEEIRRKEAEMHKMKDAQRTKDKEEQMSTEKAEQLSKKKADNSELEQGQNGKAIRSKKRKKNRRKSSSYESNSSSGSESSSSASSLHQEIFVKKQKLEPAAEVVAGCSGSNEKQRRENNYVFGSDKPQQSDSELSEDCSKLQVEKRKQLKKKKKPPSTSDSKSGSDSDTTSDSDSDSETSSSSGSSQRKKKSKKQVKNVERNLEIYPGVNYKYAETDSGVVKLHENFDVFVKKADLDSALKLKNQSLFVRNMLEKVYCMDALLNTTPTGHPPRSKGSRYYKDGKILPRLHPDGLDAIIQKCLEAENSNKKWRPRMLDTVLMMRISNKCCELTRKYRKKNKKSSKSARKK